MEYYVNQRQMKAIDTGSIEKNGIPSMVLMERAALSVAEYIMEHFSPSAGRICSVCGMGNNGADGIAAARILFLKGYQTEIFLFGDPEKATTEWKEQYTIIQNLKIPFVFFQDSNREYFAEYIKTKAPAAFIDGLFGIGLTREITGTCGLLIHELNQSGIPVIAVDIPSGVRAEDGRIAGAAVKAEVTVTFGRKKVGQILYPGAEYCGKLIVKEIGFAPDAIADAGYDAFGLENRREVCGYLKKRPADSHKGTFGSVLVVAGCETMVGAAVFSAKAAYRMGCGLVKVRSLACNKVCLHQMIPEAILSLYDPEKPLDHLKEDCNFADVIVFGPGIGQEQYVDEMLFYILTETTKPLVLDADGLRVLARHRDWYDLLTERVILTPHPGEMSALTGKNVKEIKEQPFLCAKDFSNVSGSVCVLKGARTIVAKKNQPCYINTSGCSAMATAGSGDVLTGMIAGFLAEKHPTDEAAMLGVYIHGLAGEYAAEKLGERAVMATDLVEAIGPVFRELESVFLSELE